MLAEMYFRYSQNSTRKVTKIKEIFWGKFDFSTYEDPALAFRKGIPYTIFLFINSSLFDKLFKEIPGQARQVSKQDSRYRIASEHAKQNR